MVRNRAGQTHGLLTLLAISIDLQCAVLVAEQATRSRSGRLEVVVQRLRRVVGRLFGPAVALEALLAVEFFADVTMDKRGLILANTLNIIRVHGGEGLFLLVQIQDKGIHRQRGHPFLLRDLKGSTTEGARGGGRGVVSDQRIGGPQGLFNAAETEGVEAGQGTRIPQSLATNGTVLGRILLKA